MRINRINFLDVRFDRLTFDDVVDRLRSARADSPYAYVVTPNVDHLVRVHREPALQRLYEGADLCLCDSRILRFLGRLRGVRLPLVPGSDLSTALLTDIAQARDRIAVVGGSTASLRKLHSRFPHIDFLHHEPPMGLREDRDARRQAAAFVASSNARFTLLAVGSPQQEMIASEVREQTGAGGLALCVGAALDFLTGDEPRAPKLMQRMGLEWAHRLRMNPRRMWRRYLVEGTAIIPIWFRWRSGRRSWVPIAVAAGVGLTLIGVYAANSYTHHSPFAGGIDTRFLPPAKSVAAINLPPPNLLKPLSPEEATKENSDRPFVNRPDTPVSGFVLKTDTEDRDRALTCMTQAVYYEAAGEGADGGRAVAQVVLNRMHHPGYPASVCGVVYQGADRATGCQFTFTCDGSLLRTPAASLWARSRKIAQEALAGHVFAPIGHATHYHADYVLPYWADSLDKTIQIGRHIFYRLRSSLGDNRSFFQRYAGKEPALPTPNSPIVIPPEAVTHELANALLSDGIEGVSKDVEKASPAASSALLIDESHGTLLSDAAGAPALTKRAKSSADCSTISDHRKLVPLGSNDMRAQSTVTC